MYRKCLLTGALASALALSGCAQMESQWDAFNEWFQPTKALTSVINPYRPDTHQGNLITKTGIHVIEIIPTILVEHVTQKRHTEQELDLHLGHA